MKTAREAIEHGDTAALADVLKSAPETANETIVSGANNEVNSHPLHYISDTVFNGLQIRGQEADITRLLLAHGSNVDGNPEHETPLIGATSLGVPDVAMVLIDAGADVHQVAVFGASALHWAAYMGLPRTIERLLVAGASIEARCSEFDSTPLFWAVQGFSQYGPDVKAEQVDAARVLIEKGADLATKNVENASLVARARDSVSDAMVVLLTNAGAQ